MFKSAQLTLIQGDITKQTTEAIVNAANASLLGGGGVDGAIHRAAGPQLLEACRALGGCPTGEARITLGFRLAAKYVIHTVGPVWHGGTADEDRLLASCYRTSLDLAVKHEISTIAFPAISTGAYGYPLERAASIALASVRESLAQTGTVRRVVFVCFGADAYQAYQALGL